LVPLPDVLPLPVAPPEGDDGDCGLFFGCWPELPAEPLVEPLVLPDGLAVLPLLALLSLSQPDKSVPARASAKATERIRFMGIAPFEPRKEQQPRPSAGLLS
jgi:hypothetical protein